MKNRFSLEFDIKESDYKTINGYDYIVEMKYTFNEIDTISVARYTELLRYTNSFLVEILEHMKKTRNVDSKSKDFNYQIRIAPQQKGSFITLIEIGLNNAEQFIDIANTVIKATNHFIISNGDQMLFDMITDTSYVISDIAEFCEIHDYLENYRNYGPNSALIDVFLTNINENRITGKIVAKALTVYLKIYKIICNS